MRLSSLSLTRPERDAIGRLLQDRRSRLIEKVGDTAETGRARMEARKELHLIASAMAKLNAS
jgi:hypothetical protein